MIGPVLVVFVVFAAVSGVAFLVLWLDRYTTEPVLRLVLVALWGVGCSFVLRLAGPALGLVVSPDPVFAIPEALQAVGLLEALLLAAGLAVLATSHYLEGPLDGAVYGTVAGLGLAATTCLAALHAGRVPPDPSVLMFLTLVGAAAAAAVGAGVGFAKLAVRTSLRAPFVLAAVVVAGAVWWLLLRAANWGLSAWGPRNIPFRVALVVVAGFFLCGVFLGALALERRVLTQQLTDEVALGVLPSWVVDVLPSYRRRIRSEWWRRRDERREIVRLLLSLAFRKQRLRGLPEERARIYGLEVGRLRQRARTLLALPANAGPRPVGEA
jgi:hypothetical protein